MFRRWFFLSRAEELGVVLSADKNLLVVEGLAVLRLVLLIYPEM
jgi:hypothetical protein